jgi:hypothetical protein
MISQLMASSSEPAPNRKANPFQSSSQLSFSFRIDIGGTNPIIMVSRAHLKNIQRLQMQREQQARSLTVMQQPATLALSPHQLPMIQPPLNVDANPILEQAVLAIQREYTPDSSNDIYDNKTTDFFLIATITTLLTTTIRSWWMLTNSTASCSIKRFETKRKEGGNG